MTGMTDKGPHCIEEILLNSVKTLLSGRVNELLGEMEFPLPPVECGQSSFAGLSGAAYSMVPVIRLSACERSEKERIIRLDAYSLTITFTVPEGPEAERDCYAYAWAADRAVGEDPALGGAASRAVVTGKKYSPPKHPGTGGVWEVVLAVRVTVEGGSYAS
jgi:hypothetical protein